MSTHKKSVKQAVKKPVKQVKVAPVEKAEKVVIDERIEAPVKVETVAPVKPVDQRSNLEAMLHNLKLNDARARLDQAREANDPDKMLACMDEINKLEGG